MTVQEAVPVAVVVAPVQTRDDRRTAVLAGVTAATVLAAVLVLVDAGTKSFWLDEGYTWSSVHRSWGAFVTHVRLQEAGGALFHAVMWAWLRLGDTEAFLRLPAGAFAVALVPVTYLLGARLFGSRAGVVAAVLTAVNANVVAFGQEARAYSCAMLLAALSCHGFVREADDPESSGRLEWVLASAALVWVQVLGAGVIVAQLVSLVWWRAPVERLRRLAAGAGAIAVLVLPMAVLILTQSSRLDGNPARFRTPTAIVQAVISLAGMGGAPLVLAYGALLAGAGVLWWRAWFRERAVRAARAGEPAEVSPDGPTDVWRIGLLVSVLVVPTALTIAAGLLQKAFWARYLLVSLPALVVLGAFALTRLTARWLSVAVAAMVLLSSVGLWRWYTGMPKDDWRDATSYVLAHGRPGDAVVFAGDEGRIPFEYYLHRHGALDTRLVPAFPAAAWGSFRTGDQRRVLPTISRLRTIAARHDRVWVFEVYAGPNDDRDEAARRLRSGLGRTMSVTQAHEFDIDLHVMLYTRR